MPGSLHISQHQNEHSVVSSDYGLRYYFEEKGIPALELKRIPISLHSIVDLPVIHSSKEKGMAEWIKKGLKLRRVLGFVKDKVTVGRAVARRGRFTNLHVAVVRATSHEEAPADDKHVKSVLAAGTGSRIRMSYCVRLLMNRLTKTQNWAVALKCLILIHKGLRDGGFIFQDQLSFYPARGGRNYLNLSKFKDKSSPFTWEASSWIRWYAKFLEQWLLTCRILGVFLDSKSSNSKVTAEKVSSLETEELVREIVALHDLLQEICGCPAQGSLINNALVQDALRLVILDSFKTQEELRIRLREVSQRLTNLKGSEALQLVQVCEKLTMQSLKLIHLIEVGQHLNLLQAYQCPARVLFTDYELMKMKEALRAPYIRNASASAIHMATSDNWLLHFRGPPLVGPKTTVSFETNAHVGRSRDHV